MVTRWGGWLQKKVHRVSEMEGWALRVGEKEDEDTWWWTILRVRVMRIHGGGQYAR